MQHTVASEVVFDGVGLHSGQMIHMVLKPAAEDTGIVFVRTDISDRDNKVPAHWERVIQSQLCTLIQNDDEVQIGTIEHLMAALRGCGIDNVIVELDGPEVPIMDGSSELFVESLDDIGATAQNKPRRVIKVLKKVSIEEDGKTVSLSPASSSVFAGAIDFDHPVIGQQDYKVSLVNGNFRHDIANCRTFGFLHEVEAMHKAGLALGGSLDNAIILDREKVLNNSGLRREDEFIRHKLLDAIGDLFLAGHAIVGEYFGDKPSHALNNKLLRALFADELAWTYVDNVPTTCVDADLVSLSDTI